jgi:hypothetical protein
LSGEKYKLPLNEDFRGHGVITDSPTGQKIEKIVELGKKELGIDPESSDHETASLGNDLRQLAEIFFIMLYQRTSLPKKQDLLPILEKIVQNNQESIRLLEELPEIIQGEIEFVIDEVCPVPPPKLIDPQIINEISEAAKESFKKGIKKALDEDDKKELNKPPDRFDLGDFLGSMIQLDAGLKEILDTYSPKSTQRYEDGMFIRGVQRILKKAPLKRPKYGFITKCFEILDPERSPDAISRAISRAKR